MPSYTSTGSNCVTPRAEAEDAVVPIDTPCAHDVAKRLIEQAPDEEWLRILIDDLDQRLRTRPLERLLTLWSLSEAQGAELFCVSRRAFMKWLKKGPPAERAEAIAALAAATDLLAHHLKHERVAAVVRRENPQLSGRSLLELASAGEYTKVRSAVEMMFGWRRIQRASQQGNAARRNGLPGPFGQ